MRTPLLSGCLALCCAAFGFACTFTSEADAPGSGELWAQEASSDGELEAGFDDSLRRMLAVPAPGREQEERALSLLEEAGDHLRRDRHGRALSALEGALALLPGVEDWAPLLRAEVLAEAGDTARVEANLALLSPGTELMERWGWELRLRAAEESGDRARAIGIARDWAEEAEPGAARARILAWAGSILVEGEDPAAARILFFDALRAAPGSPGGLRAARGLDELGDLREEEKRSVGETLLRHGDWRSGYRWLSEYLETSRHPPEESAPFRLALGEALFRLGRFPDAETLLARLAVEGGEAQPGALYWLGRSQLARGREADARVSLSRLAALHPEAPEAARALLLLAERDDEAGRRESARGYFEQLLTLGLDGSDAELAAVRFGSEDYLRGAFDSAARIFEQYAEGSRGTQGLQQAAYWAALAHARRGDGAQAEERLRRVHEANPLSFYGILAGERLDRPILPADLPPGPAGQVPGGGELENAYRNAALRIRVHQLVPTRGSLAYELDRLFRHFEGLGDEALYGYAEYLVENGLPMRGILVGRDIQRRDGAWNVRLLRIVYPFPHRETIAREARSRNLDPFFVAGLIRQESMFEADIRSPAGAVGLMQIMPTTGREIAGTLGISPFSSERLEDPGVNVRMGTYFLSSLIRRFDGDVLDALSGYNAGPTRARNWRSLPARRDQDVFLEHIPFRETRNYVKVVQQNARIYAALYGCEDFSPCPEMSYGTYLRERAGGAAGVGGLARR